jgi:hypothetical protein
MVLLLLSGPMTTMGLSSGGLEPGSGRNISSWSCITFTLAKTPAWMAQVS